MKLNLKKSSLICGALVSLIASGCSGIKPDAYMLSSESLVPPIQAESDTLEFEKPALEFDENTEPQKPRVRYVEGEGANITLRGQNPGGNSYDENNSYGRQPLTPNTAAPANRVAQGPGVYAPGQTPIDPATGALVVQGPPAGNTPFNPITPANPFPQSNRFGETGRPGSMQLPPNFADVDAFVSEGQSGQILIGAGINSDAGVTGQFIISERNFDIRRFPSSWNDFSDGTAFRGGGQGFRLEALPGNQVQRYLLNFTEPYLFDTNISFGASGYYFTRDYFDWKEQRLGGRVSLGYRLSPDLSLTVATRMEDVKIFDPRVGAPEITRALGSNDLYVGQVSLAHDTRDHPFLATEGHYFELGFQQGFGEFDYSRGDIDWRQYFLLRQRPDGSGRHTVGISTRVGVTGSQTPVFENYFAGGFSTLRGFDFRGASPVSAGARVGGQFRVLNSVEYMFPLTPDDMIRGVLFVDYGTVEPSMKIDQDTFRVAPGFGFRVSMPFAGSGGAPLAFDFAFPVMKADTDDTRVFSFYMGFLR